MIMSSTAFCFFDWDKERITLDSIKNYYDELDQVHKLKKITLDCSHCGKRKLFDIKIADVEYCSCSKKCSCHETERNEWVPYIERKNMLIWRREDQPGLYAYKRKKNSTNYLQMIFKNDQI